MDLHLDLQLTSYNQCYNAIIIFQNLLYKITASYFKIILKFLSCWIQTLEFS